MSDNSGDKSVLGSKDEIIKRLHQKAAGRVECFEAGAEWAKQGLCEWRDIESAPRDGTKFDIYFSDGMRQTNVFRKFDRWNYSTLNSGVYVLPNWIFDQSTHWMPLPEPPKESK
jgi:hypothetical protein